MIYKSAVEQIKGAKAAESEMLLPVFRLGTVTSLSSGRAYIQFYGETTASGKLYPYLEGYKPTVGDKVLILQQGSTYIIAGKISKDNVVDNYYMLKSLADQTYLTKAVADTLYEPLGGGGGGNGDEIKNTKYGLGFNNTTGADIVPKNYDSSTGSVNLGTTSKKLGTGYFTTLGGNSSSNAIQTAHIKDWAVYGYFTGDILPSSNNTYSIGSSTYKIKKLFVNDISLYGNFVFGSWKPNDNYTFHLDAVSNSSGGATFTPSGNADWGTSSNKFKTGYFTTLHAATLSADSSAGATQNAYIKALKMYGDITAASSNSYNLGSSSGYFATTWSKYAYIDRLYMNVTGSSHPYLSFAGGQTYPQIAPADNQKYDLGSSSYQFRNVYAKQFYQSGTAISTSDRRKKTGIKDFTKKYVDFFKRLKPKLFRFKDGESGRLHSGFIAQDVEEAAVESGIPTKDLAFLCIDENGDYGLRYEELIALQTKIIQDLMERVEILEEKIKGGK